MPEGESSAAPSWDLESVSRLLTARSAEAAEAAWVDALPELSKVFPPETWVVDCTINTYGPGAHRNLYEVESQSDFKAWLSGQGVDEEAYAGAVGAVQYVSVQLHLLSLMPRARSNKGWRIRAIGFPALKVIAIGLASHYQGTQNHNQMGRASGRIRARALEVLSGEARAELQNWPAATAEEWEERGLMQEPVHFIGDLDISGFDSGKGAKLRMIRNTTVKKELATFFAIKGMAADSLAGDGSSQLEALQWIAIDLGRVAEA
jgi:hypothetical protein